MTTPDTAADELRELHERLVTIHQVLAAVRSGDESARVGEDLPESHPLSSLHRDLNAVLAALAAERDRATRRREELEDALSTVEMQRAALRDLSTPIIEVWSGVLCLPVVGMIDSERSAQMMDELLRAVSAKSASHLVIDVTAVNAVDSATLSHFIAIARAVRLLGAECVLTGIRPYVAQTLASMDVELHLLTTRSNLRDALSRILAQRAGAGALPEPR